MIDTNLKLNSVVPALGKYGRSAWRYLSFSPADNFFSIVNVVSISIESDGIYCVSGTKLFWKISVKQFKKYALEENKELTPEYFAAVVSRALEEMDAGKATLTLNIPRSWTITQTAEFPVTVKENLANVMSYELDRLTPLTPDNAYYDYKIIDETADKIKVLLTVTRADRINPFLAALRNKNIKIEKLGVSSLVLAKVIRDTYKTKNALYISAGDGAYECGAMINNFTVRSLSGRLAALDDANIGQVIEAARPLMNLFPKTGNPAKIVIRADEKHFKMLRDGFTQAAVSNLLRDNAYCLPKGDKNISPFALGGFLETAAADPGAFNLLAGKNGNPQKTPYLVSLILIAAIIGLGAYHLLSPVLMEQKSVEQIDAKISSLKPEMKKIEALKKEIDTLSASIKVINDFKKHSVQKMDVLKEITQILPDNIWLTRLRVDELSVEIEGYADSATAIIPKIENSKYFQKAEFASPTVRDQRQNRERFLIKTELKDESKPVKQEKAGEKNEQKK